VRLAVKDLFDTAGLATTYGSILFVDHVPPQTAEAVSRLEAGGYVNVGKANLHEFAYGTTSENPHFGTVPNPRATERVAGGSSGGSAAALAAGLADAALGTDSGGSIRIPAACCGIVGFKPTFDLVSTEGCWPLAPTFDHAGPMARDVDGCIGQMRVLAEGFAPAVLESLEEVEIGVAWLDRADPLVRARVEEAASNFPRSRVLEPPAADGVGRLFMREVADVHHELFAEHADSYGPDVRVKIERSLAVTDAEASAAEGARAEYRERLGELVGDVDLMLTPSIPCVAPPVGAGGIGDLDVRERLTSLTFPINALGWPALALPCGDAEDGLPASVQLVGKPGADGLVLAAGRLLERALASSSK
jgi:aspartyl-tRNA(Asn)/glutamyl-tRNA(Gln) amidotransferase subunit A